MLSEMKGGRCDDSFGGCGIHSKGVGAGLRPTFFWRVFGAISICEMMLSGVASTAWLQLWQAAEGLAAVVVTSSAVRAEVAEVAVAVAEASAVLGALAAVARVAEVVAGTSFSVESIVP